MRRFFYALMAVVILFAAPAVARADDSGGGDGGGGGPAPYADFTKGAQAQHGLFTVWRKDGKVFLEISPKQLDVDFIQTAVPRNGIGGYFFFNGSTDFAPARLIRFSKVDDKIAISWPNTDFIATNDSAALAISQTFATSLVDVAPIVSTDDATGDIVFDASPFLGDVLDVATTLKNVLNVEDPENGYRLDPQRTYFGPTKAFPDNVIIEADQTFASDLPNVIDNVPDPRSLLIKVDYNIASAPDNSDFMPRLADDRVGYFDNTHLEFGDDNVRSRDVRYIIKWNEQPSDPAKKVSPSKHPLVFYLSSTIPPEYRPAVRDALLTWNKAFLPLGISDAVIVKDQPDPSVDPAWDPDDIRYNVVRWLTESNSGGFAEAQLVYDPRTGQEFHTGIVIDADLMQFGSISYPFEVQPSVTATKTFSGTEALYAQGMRREAGFGMEALQMMGLTSGYQVPEKYKYGYLKSIVLHESGHDWGLQHNFIGSDDYTMKQLQDPAFTASHGVATSVMEYSPINLWPKGYRQGDFWQTTLGPYDYYAIHWGYAKIPGARSPQSEVGTLDQWASAWSDPRFRFASDEDVAWANAHAIDPRVNHWDLSNDTLGWCDTRIKLANDLLDGLDKRFPRAGQSYEEERDAFGFAMGEYLTCAVMPEHFIGGEWLSRAHAGDPHSSPPLTPEPRSEEQRAFSMLDKYVFGDSAWQFSPLMLNRMTYSEWSPFWENGSWSYDPADRHDIPVAELAEGIQDQELRIMFQPLMLSRIDDMSLRAKPGQTMSLADLFSWTQASVFGDLRRAPVGPIALIHRSEQQSYAALLSSLLLAPAPGTPYDAQALARLELTDLQSNLRSALASPRLDTMTRAHLLDLQVRVDRTLDARTVIPASG
jgi:uncharacterized protein DUF4953/uncharacterized protein DUF5117/uncharacterized protein DUF5118